MKKHYYDWTGTKLLRIEEAEPVCGEDFCDRCGDCLECYGGDPCYESEDGEHYWVEYLDEKGEPVNLTAAHFAQMLRALE